MHSNELIDAIDKVLKSLETEDAPAIRVGAASVVVDGKIYLWGGRGGAAMTPLDERGIFHIYDPKTSKWTQTPVPTGDIPEPRSYHALAAMNVLPHETTMHLFSRTRFIFMVDVLPRDD